jgi:hypothetical protein
MVRVLADSAQNIIWQRDYIFSAGRCVGLGLKGADGKKNGSSDFLKMFHMYSISMVANTEVQENWVAANL